MNKEQFVRKLHLIQNFHSEQETLSALVNKISDGFSVVTIGDCLVGEIINTINEEMDIDDKDLISWWLYENVKKIIYLINGEEVKVETAEELYNYLVEEIL